MVSNAQVFLNNVPSAGKLHWVIELLLIVTDYDLRWLISADIFIINWCLCTMVINSVLPVSFSLLKPISAPLWQPVIASSSTWIASLCDTSHRRRHTTRHTCFINLVLYLLSFASFSSCVPHSDLYKTIHPFILLLPFTPNSSTSFGRQCLYNCCKQILIFCTTVIVEK